MEIKYQLHDIEDLLQFCYLFVTDLLQFLFHGNPQIRKSLQY